MNYGEKKDKIIANNLEIKVHKVLERDFFLQDSLDVAHDLIGKILVFNNRKIIIMAGIDADNAQMINGPGKLCKELNISKKHNKIDLVNSIEFHVLNTNFKPKIVSTLTHYNFRFSWGYEPRKGYLERKLESLHQIADQ